MTSAPNGLAVIDKPAGWTSHDVVAKSRGILGTKKVGHSGTLDPDATGVLLLGVGTVTRLLRFLSPLPKSYTCEIVFGVETSTLDAAGEVTATHAMSVSLDDVRAGARALSGDLLQVPPMVSAVSVGGKRLHELARQGIEIEREERPVRITQITLESAGPAQLCLDVACSKGTYVRVLAEDIGAALGTAAHLGELRRTAFGDFTIDQAVPLEAFDPAQPRGLVALRAAVAHLPAVSLDAHSVQAVRQGKSGVLARLAGVSAPAAALVDPDGHLAAVAVREHDRWRYGRVLAPDFTQ